MMRRFALFVVLGVALEAPAISSEPLYINPSSVTVQWGREATIRLIPRGPHSVSWDVTQGHCYSHQMASARINGWQRENGYYYFPVTISAMRPGTCEMIFKSTSGAEARLWVTVTR
jgi:hypothetical protein